MLNHRRSRMFRCSASGALVIAAGFMSNLGAQPATSGAAQTPAASHRTLVNDYCLSCHNGRAQTAGLELDAINALELDDNRETWEKVVRKLRARQMPLGDRLRRHTRPRLLRWRTRATNWRPRIRIQVELTPSGGSTEPSTTTLSATSWSWRSMSPPYYRVARPVSASTT